MQSETVPGEIFPDRSSLTRVTRSGRDRMAIEIERPCMTVPSYVSSPRAATPWPRWPRCLSRSEQGITAGWHLPVAPCRSGCTASTVYRHALRGWSL